MNLSHYLYIITAFIAIFIQSRSRTLQDLLQADAPSELALSQELTGLLKLRRFMSPFIAGLTALLIAIAVFSKGENSGFLPPILIPVWIMASVGDIFIEGAYSIQDEKKQGRFYLIGMVLFMGMTFLMGLGLILNANRFDLSQMAHIVSILIPILFGIGAFKMLKLDKDTFGPMVVYDLAVSVLLCGGIYSAFAGLPRQAYIGIAYFCSDALVGQRDFGRYRPAFLDRWILLMILVLYYSIMLVSVDIALYP